MTDTAVTQRLNRIRAIHRSVFDRMTAYEMAVKLNTWLMKLANLEGDPNWRDDPLSEFAMAGELVERLRVKARALGFDPPDLPDVAVMPIGFSVEAWTWVWWVMPGLEMLADPAKRGQIEMLLADAVGRH